MKKLVIYYSHIGENWMKNGIENIEKGNTEIVAEKIAEFSGADLFKVETIKKYPHEYYACCDEAKEELNKNIRPELLKELDNIDEYDQIYIGGPVWWGHLPMAMFTQLEKLNFEGKTVFPFTTHEGSGLGQVMDDINKLCKGANIEKGLAIRGIRASLCDKDLKSWIK